MNILDTFNNNPELEKLNTDIENHRKTLNNNKEASQPGYALTLFKEVADNFKLEEAFAKHPDLMDRKVQKLKHASNFKMLLKDVAATIPSEDVMDMIEYIKSNETTRLAVKINDKSSHQAAAALYFMANKCPTENKTEMYKKLETYGILDNILRTSDETHIGKFIASAFNDVNTKKALAMLETSSAWLAVPKTPNLRDWLIESNDHLLPAMQYGNTPQNGPTQKIS